MSDINTNDITTMNSADNGAGAGKAVWDDTAVADMYFTLAEMRGGLHGEEAKQLEERMRTKGYGFTSTQFVNKHNNLRKRLGGDRPAAGATAEAKQPKAKGKTQTPRKSRAKTPAVDTDGNPVAAKPKAAAKPRGMAAAKKEVHSDGNAIEAEAPPTKKRKASGAKAGKKVNETVADVKDEEAEFDSAGSANSAGAMKVDGAADADGDTMIVEEYDAPEGEGEQAEMVEATKVEIEEETVDQAVTKTFQPEAHTVVQTSA